MHYSQFQLENWKQETMINMDFNCSVWTGIIPLGTGTPFGFASTRQRRSLFYKMRRVSKLSDSFIAKKDTDLWTYLIFMPKIFHLLISKFAIATGLQY